MAKKYGKGGGAGDGSKVPAESAELDGNIITAAKSTMEQCNYEEGYPLPSMFLHMSNKIGRAGGK
jgi:hypothetical protein